MDNVHTFLILYSRVFIAGIVASLILGDVLSILSLILYFGYEFKLISIVYFQIPELYRTKYRNKLLSFLKWLCDVLEDNEAIIDNTVGRIIELEDEKEIDPEDNVELIENKHKKVKVLKVKIRTPEKTHS